MHYSIIVLPGLTCEQDCYDAVSIYSEEKSTYVWYTEKSLPDTDCVIIPGGFSYGDYLRAGALAKTAPIVKAIKKFANDGGSVLGICNGFQILTEIGLLPGTLMKNNSLKFMCKDVYLKVVNNKIPFTNLYKENEVIQIPIAHMEGKYFADDKTLGNLIDNNQIVFQYCNEAGMPYESSNPNGSRYNIAGICNKKGNVMGMMPHPERNIDNITGNQDGLKLFTSIYNSFKRVKSAGLC